MKTILAFGDSLTWGHDPVDGGRLPYETRWPVVLQRELGNAEVISEALCGRSTVFDDHAGSCDRNGARALPVALSSHMPLDLVILMLGTNDLKACNAPTADLSAKGMKRLIQIVRHHPWDKPRCAPPALLVVAPPPHVGPRHPESRVAQSRRLAPLFRAEAEAAGAAFFDAGSVISASEVDGTHLDAEATAGLGRALAPLCREMLGTG